MVLHVPKRGLLWAPKRCLLYIAILPAVHCNRTARGDREDPAVALSAPLRTRAVRMCHDIRPRVKRVHMCQTVSVARRASRLANQWRQHRDRSVWSMVAQHRTRESRLAANTCLERGRCREAAKAWNQHLAYRCLCLALWALAFEAPPRHVTVRARGAERASRALSAPFAVRAFGATWHARTNSLHSVNSLHALCTRAVT